MLLPQLRISSLEEEIRPLKSSEKMLKAKLSKVQEKFDKLLPECEDLRIQADKLDRCIIQNEKLQVCHSYNTIYISPTLDDQETLGKTFKNPSHFLLVETFTAESKNIHFVTISMMSEQ